MTFDTIITVFVGLMVAAAFAFFKKKGENQATKQDIIQITNLIEGVKDDFARRLHIFQIRFTVFHQKQAEVIAELYRCLYEAEIVVRRYIRDDGESADNAEKAVIALQEYFGKHRLYLHETDLCETLESISEKMWEAVHKKLSAEVSEGIGEEGNVFLKEAWDTIDKEVRALMHDVERHAKIIWLPKEHDHLAIEKY